MKETFQKVLHLAKPELRVSWGNFIGLFLFFSIYTFLFITGFDVLNSSKLAILDLLYLMLFVSGPTWFRAKGIQYQQIGGNMWGSPAVIMNLHLPIKKKVIVWKTLFIYFLSSIPFQLLMLIAVYLFQPAIREMLAPSSYLAFMIIWLSFGIYAGLGAIYLEVVVYKMTTNIMINILSILSVILAIAFVLFFPYLFENSILVWTFIIADKWSVASVIISISLAAAGLYYWSNQMIKQLSEVDYL